MKTVPILEQLESVLGFIVGTPDGLAKAMDCSAATICHNLPIPDDMTQTLYNELTEDLLWYEQHQNQYPTYENATRYAAGPLLKLSYDRMMDKLNSQPSAQFYLYSGHDTGFLLSFSLFFGFCFELGRGCYNRSYFTDVGCFVV